MGLSVPAWVCLSVCLCVFASVNFVSTARSLTKIKDVKDAFCRFSHLSSNGIITKIVLRDLDLHFRFQKFKIYEIRSFSYVAGS